MLVYRMVTTIFFAFFVAFHIFVVSYRRGFIFDAQVDKQNVPERGVVTLRDPF